jgi:hypothetical protein
VWWVVALVVFIVVADRLLLRAERRGWIFYRHRKPTSGSMSSAAFGSVAEIMQPGRRITIEQQQSDQVRRQSFKDGEDR